MAVTFLMNNGNFVKSLTFSPKEDTVLICTQTSPSQKLEKLCAEAMLCQILKKLFSHIFLFVSITCKSGVYACVSSMQEKCAGNTCNHKNLITTHRRFMSFESELVEKASGVLK